MLGGFDAPPVVGLYEGSTCSQSPQGDGSYQGWVSFLLGSFEKKIEQAWYTIEFLQRGGGLKKLCRE